MLVIFLNCSSPYSSLSLSLFLKVFCVYEDLLAYMFVYHHSMPGACQRQKEQSNHLKLELQIAVSHHMGAVRTQVLCKRGQCSYLLSHLSVSPPHILRQGFSLNLELINSANLIDQQGDPPVSYWSGMMTVATYHHDQFFFFFLPYVVAMRSQS